MESNITIDTQTLIVSGIALVMLFFLVRYIVHIFRSKKGTGCGCHCGCSSTQRQADDKDNQ